MQGRENFGKLGKVRDQSKSTCGIGGKFQTTTKPPPPPGAHAVHQMAGTIVSLSSLVVVIQVFVVTPGGCMISVEMPGGTVVIVEVIPPVVELPPGVAVLTMGPVGIAV
jgi:hypothetical protein